MSSILIIAGENSGERYGARLVHEFKKTHPSFSFFGIGGKEMEKQGVDLLFPIKDMAVVGGFEILSHLPRLKKIFNHIQKETKRKKPVASVLIDSPDFNMRLAKKLKKQSIPVLYYISPTVWAWRKGRLKTLKKTIQKMLLIFPFEEKIYNEHGIPATYVGHPLREYVKVSLSRKEFHQKYELDPEKKVISILPGSRKSELKFHLPILFRALDKIRGEFESQYLFLLAENLESSLIHSFISSYHNNLKLLAADKYDAMAYSHLVLAACGTSNLEAALLGVPLISFYRILPLTYSLGKRFVHLKNYSIVNILAGKEIIPELIQKDFTPENIFQETKKILGSEQSRLRMIENFKSIKTVLGESQASQNAAKELEKIIFLKK